MRVFGGVACVLALSGVALAEPVTFPVGGPVDGNSWSISILNTGWSGVDFMGFVINSPGDTFESPVFSNSSVAGWGAIGNFGATPTIFAASGPGFVNQSHDIKFAGNSSDPISFTNYFFVGSTFQQAFRWDWDGSSWDINALGSAATLTRADFEMAVIPLPSAAALALFGLAAVGTRRQRTVA